MRVWYTPRAKADLDSINDYLKQRSPPGARNVLTAIYRATVFIAEQPHGAQATDNPEVRMKLVAKYPYKIFYRIGNGRIDVIHIRHTARRPWQGR